MDISNVIAILKNLQYRIDISPASDPERDAAIRLRDRLLDKYGISLDTITRKVGRFQFGRYTKNEAQLVIQYMAYRVHLRDEDFDLYTTRPKKGKCYYIEATMDVDTYNAHHKILDELLTMYKGKYGQFKKKLEQDIVRQLDAWSYMFFKEAGLLGKPSEDKESKMPSWGLAEAIKAARDLEGTIFPQNFVEQKQRELTCGGVV